MNLKIVFTGKDRGNKDYIIQQTKKLDLEKEVVFLDFIERDELGSLYKNAYALIYPSLAGPDSIVALEALYFNCPVLISNHLGYHQQLKKSALYFNPLSELDIVEKIKQLSDLATKDDLIANGQLIIKENSCKNYVDSFLNMVDNFYLLRQCWSLDEDYRNKE